jgi:hypothetical protein
VIPFVAALTALTGLAFVHRVVRGAAGHLEGLWTVVALLFGTFLLPSLAGADATLHAASFALVALALTLWWNQDVGGGGRLRFAFAAAAALAGAALPLFGHGTLPRPEPGSLMESLFASPRGLLFGSPVLWAGFLGLVPLARREARRVAAPAILLFLVLLESTARTGASGSVADGRFHAALPVLGLGLGVSLGWLRALVAGRPWVPIAVTGGLLTVWNLLFMEQYRTNRIPRDLPVSFAQVTEVNAEILSRGVGSPPAWPANWLFAWRHHVTPAMYDVVAGRSLLAAGSERTAFSVGDPRVDPSLLAEGWGRKTSCAGVPCRSVAAGARLLLPLDRVRPAAFMVTAAGTGTLAIDINSTRVAEMPLGGALARHDIPLDVSLWHPGVNEVRLSYSGSGEARVAGFGFGGEEAR